MKLFKTILITTGLCALTFSLATAQTVFSWDDGGSNSRFNNSGNWDPDGVPGPGDTGNVASSLVEIGTAGEMQTGATINLNGTSTLQRLSVSFSNFDGTLNINDQTNVQITVWRPSNNGTLNWSSTGTFELAPSGNASQQRFFMDNGDNNDNTVVNMSAGFWDLTGNTHTDSFSMEAGVFNMTGGLMVTDQRFKIGTTGGGGTFNYGAGAELRVDSMGLFADGVFNMEPGSTVYIYAGLLGGLGGQDGADYFRDELRNGVAGSNIYLDGVQQILGASETLADSNFTHEQLQIDGVWYDGITAVPEPRQFAVAFGVLALGLVLIRRRKLHS